MLKIMPVLHNPLKGDASTAKRKNESNKKGIKLNKAISSDIFP